MKKFLVMLMGIVGVLFVLSGCSDNPVQEELLDYQNKKMASLGDKEQEIIGKYASVTGANYTDDETLHKKMVDEVVPEYNAFIDGLEKVTVDNEELQKLHNKYVEAAKIQSKGFATIVIALEKQDAVMVQDANTKLEKARSMMNDYDKGLKKLANEHDVEFEKKK